jgi:hypothetical protein
MALLFDLLPMTDAPMAPTPAMTPPITAGGKVFLLEN